MKHNQSTKKTVQVPNQPTSNHGEITARQGRCGDPSVASTYSCEGTAHRGTQGRITKNACLLQLYQNNTSASTHRGQPQYIATAMNRQIPMPTATTMSNYCLNHWETFHNQHDKSHNVLLPQPVNNDNPMALPSHWIGLTSQIC